MQVKSLQFNFLIIYILINVILINFSFSAAYNWKVINNLKEINID